ncbi:MAG: hypothetical protein CVV28_04220 [Methanobacteriales archaeon HGW-Methanobacteriales-1]|nr:MAG: hypothetical protein CVV28_04220 [Methanobacteriales archaeon HGW-Methanobacteriales-1]
MSCIILLCGAASAAELPVTTNASGNVSGDLYFDAQEPTAWSNQTQNTGVSQEAKFNFASNYTNVKYAKLYTMVYVGGTDNRTCNVNVTFDGNNDGNYETILENTITLNTASGSNGTIYWQDDHISRVYSDYLLSYDVKDYIQNGTVNTKVETSPGASNMDGRIKFIALIVAYDDGDNDRIEYWVNDGHQWFSATSRNTTFDTTSLSSGWDSAEVKMIHTSSSDGNYTFNGVNKTGGAPATGYNYKINTWNVTSDIAAGNSSILTYSRVSGSLKIPIVTLKVKYSATKPDLNASNVEYNPGAGANLFANEPNNIRVTINNNGNATSGPFNVTLNIGTYTETQLINSLANGSSTTVTFTGYTPTANGTVNIGVLVDSTNDITEYDETNNQLSVDPFVYYNGYKGKSYTNGSDFNTTTSFEGRYDLIYSIGNSVYHGANWDAFNATWTAANLVIPTGATVVKALLYQPWSYNKEAIDPAYTMTFNNALVNKIASYKDQKGFGEYNFPYGTDVYDVTALFNTSGNNLTVTPETAHNYALFGTYMIVVYSDPATTFKKIFINDEFDSIKADNTYSVNSTEATAYANFNNLTTAELNNAKSIVILASAGDPGKSKYFFNGNEYTGFWNNFLGGPQIGFSSYDVSSSLINGDNKAAIQSFLNGTTGDNMYLLSNILVVSYLPEANFTSNVTSGHAPLSVQFHDNSSGNITAWAWDFNNDGTVDSTEQNPIHLFNDVGTYTVKLTVTGNGGNDTTTSTITVTDGTAPTVSADIKGGLYNAAQNVNLTMNEAGSIYYTQNGTTPTNTSTLYTGTININNTTTLKFIAIDEAGNPSTVYTETYTIDKTIPTASANIKGGLYNANKVVTLSISEAGSIYYTLNGAIPTNASTKYVGPITIASSATLKFLAIDNAGNPSTVYTETYTIDKIAPKATLTYPKNKATKVSRTSTLYVKFSESIKNSINWSKVYIKNLKNGKKVKISKWISGNTLKIKMALKRYSYTNYALYIPASAVMDNAGNKLAHSLTVKFKTGKK